MQGVRECIRKILSPTFVGDRALLSFVPDGTNVGHDKITQETGNPVRCKQHLRLEGTQPKKGNSQL